MPLMLLEILARSNGRLLCVMVIVAAVLALSLAKRAARKCPRCHALNRPPARFCAQCGAKLS